MFFFIAALTYGPTCTFLVVVVDAMMCCSQGPHQGQRRAFPSYLKFGSEQSPFWQFPSAEGATNVTPLHRMHPHPSAGWYRVEDLPRPGFKVSLQSLQLQSWLAVAIVAAALYAVSFSDSLHSWWSCSPVNPLVQISVSEAVFWGLWPKTNE